MHLAFFYYSDDLSARLPVPSAQKVAEASWLIDQARTSYNPGGKLLDYTQSCLTGRLQTDIRCAQAGFSPALTHYKAVHMKAFPPNQWLPRTRSYIHRITTPPRDCCCSRPGWGCRTCSGPPPWPYSRLPGGRGHSAGIAWRPPQPAWWAPGAAAGQGVCQHRQLVMHHAGVV
jgi:hypothetical protein